MAQVSLVISKKNYLVVEDDFLPEEIRDRIYYEPAEIGREAGLKKYLDARWKKKRGGRK